MVIALSLLGFFYVVGLLALAGALWRVPEGFEDEKGFHVGPRPGSFDEEIL
ncbi:MAG: hypothetical protein JF599_12995 [Verrucomicrobia bacterium]|nr:hypothetical protein [Verrucomicrobiota bacterium]